MASFLHLKYTGDFISYMDYAGNWLATNYVTYYQKGPKKIFKTDNNEAC